MATGAQEHIDATTAAIFIRVMYSQAAVVAREQALVLAGMTNRVFEKEITHGSSLKIPNVSNLSVVSKNTSSNAATTYETVTETAVTLTVGTWEYSAVALESFTKQQADRDLLDTYAPKQGYALGQAIDDAIATLVNSISNTVGTLAQDNTYADWLRAIQYLDDANAPSEDRMAAISPAAKAAAMKLDQFVHGDYSKLNDSVSATQRKATMGSFQGIPIMVTTNVDGSNNAGHSNVLMHKEAIALVVQMNTTTHNFFDVDYLAYKAVAEHIHGSGIIRNDHAVWMKGA